MPRMAFRVQTILADVAIAAVAFLVAYTIAVERWSNLGPVGEPALIVAKYTLLYAAIAGAFTVMFRR